MSAAEFIAEVLTIDGQRHRMPFPIAEIADLGTLVVVLQDPDSNIQKFGQFANLIAVRRDGSLLWTAELPSSKTGECYYRLRIEAGRIIAYSTGSFVVEVDSQTGRITQREFVK